MKTINKIVILAAAVLILGGAAAFLIPSGNVPVVEAPAETEIDEDDEKIADEKYCNEFSPSYCPQECAVCPPCEICSSIQCRAEASCAAIGFDKDWYHGNVVIDEIPPMPMPDGDIPGANAGMANPASVHCVEQGGEVQIREGDGGQYGMCVFPDGRECDEWGFFRSGVCGNPSDGVADKNIDDIVCGRENCHGLEIKCGPNPVEMCTMEYRLGDRCLRHVNCGIVNGACQQIPNAAFDACKACVQQCQEQFSLDPTNLFSCESRCE